MTGKGKGDHVPIYTWPGLIGSLLLLMGFGIGFSLFLTDLASEETPAYLGIFYLFALVLLVIGVVLIPIGRMSERRRRARGEPASRLHRFLVSFSERSPLYAFLFIVSVIVLVTVGLGVGSYKVYQTTETNTFCGQLCHQVMTPEFTTYHYSSHARVKCVECHIGEGAGWYVRSKLSGIRQIFAVTAAIFPRPIPTPIHNLRPARETCEQCHWPSKFIGYREFVRSYYLSGKDNDPYRIRMLMKIGGEKSKFVPGSGIHYHMLIAAKLEYIARDPKRQEIAWVRIQRADGSITEFNNTANPLTQEERAALEVRTMDCMDCHNRPAHKFPTPMDAVNNSIEQGLIKVDLPYIKLEATRALDTSYASTEEAMAGIANHLRTFYKKEYPQVVEERAEDLRHTIEEVQRIYARSIFPEMGAKWSAYPDNIGHRDWPGCFRCHNEDMQSEEGFTIFTTCNKCHLILAQGKEIDKVQVNFREGLDFFHPVDEGEYFKEYTECIECHTGGVDLYSD